MAEVNGLVGSVQRLPRGSEMVASAPIGTTVLQLDSAEDFDNAGGDLDVNGARYSYLTADLDADTVTLASPGLTTAASVGDGVYVVQGGQIALDWIAFVSTGEGDEAEVVVPYADRQLWPEGDYNPPIPVILSADLESIAAVPGRTPVIDSVTFQTASDGERIIIRNDGGAGVIEAYAGVGESVPTKIDPFLYSPLGVGNGDQPGLRLRSGMVEGPTYYFNSPATLELITGSAGAASGTIQTGRINMYAQTLNGAFNAIYFYASDDGYIGAPTVRADQLQAGGDDRILIGNGSTPVRIPSMVKQGTGTVPIATNGTPASVDVNFTTAFPSNAEVPVVQLTVRTGAPQLFQIGVTNESRSGFTVTMVRTSGAGTAAFAWTATTQPSA